MRIAAALSLLGLIASTSFAAPSSHRKKDVNIFLHKSAAVPASKKSDSPLESSTYTLTSFGLNSDQLIGRRVVEAISAPVMPISTISKNEQVKWTVERLEDDYYKLSIGSGAFGLTDKSSNDFIFAFPTYYLPTKWYLHPLESDFFSIEDPETGKVWTAGQEHWDDVQLKPQLFCPLQAFKFTPFVEDSAPPTVEDINTSLNNDKCAPCHDTVATAKGDSFDGSYVINSIILPPVPFFSSDSSTEWVIKSGPDGEYQFSNGGDSISSSSGKLVALPTDAPSTWTII